jgi:hypothetical protein
LIMISFLPKTLFLHSLFYYLSKKFEVGGLSCCLESAESS